MTRLTRSFYLGFLLCLPGLGFSTAQAADLGFVNMERVLKESKLGRGAEGRLQERFGDRTEPLAQEEMAIRQLQQTLERDKPLMSAEQAAKKETEIKEQIQAFEEKFSALQRELMTAQREEGAKILEPASRAVQAVAEKRKLSAVFESSQATLLYMDPGVDLTDDVIEQLDKNN